MVYASVYVKYNAGIRDLMALFIRKHAEGCLVKQIHGSIYNANCISAAPETLQRFLRHFKTDIQSETAQDCIWLGDDDYCLEIYVYAINGALVEKDKYMVSRVFLLLSV
jgi:hypothetical protein